MLCIAGIQKDLQDLQLPVICLEGGLQLRKELAETRAQLAIFAAVQAQAANNNNNNNNQSTIGELQCQAQCFGAFVRRIRHLAINIMIFTTSNDISVDCNVLCPLSFGLL